MLIRIEKSMLFKIISYSFIFIELFMHLRIINNLICFSKRHISFQERDLPEQSFDKGRFSNTIFSYDSDSLSLINRCFLDKKECFFPPNKSLFEIKYFVT